jgi:uncharacterized damage-inducible protein DinB
MYNTSQEIIDAHRAALDIYPVLLANSTQEQAQAARGGDEGWSVVEIMCHMRDAEEVALSRMRAMRDNDNPLIAGYDQDAFAQERKYAASDLQDVLSAFLRLRAQHVAELEALSPEEWQRPGQHSEYGPITIMSHAFHMVSHDFVHAAQIGRQLAGS